MMSSLHLANNALFCKYQQSAAALLLTDSSTSPSPSSSSSSSAPPEMSSSCALASSGYHHHHVSSGKSSGRLSFPPPASISASSSPSSSLPSSSSTSSWLCLSLSGLSGVTQPGARPPNPAEIRAGGGGGLPPGAMPLCASLQRCAAERFPGPTQLCSPAVRLPEAAFRMQQQQLYQDSLQIYPWMRSSDCKSGFVPQAAGWMLNGCGASEPRSTNERARSTKSVSSGVNGVARQNWEIW
ncbi:homeobox protein Hox-B7a isoform X2 [Solea solea]|uniref:homeobox protein Hox-B7a isoform X2 n=1 Tax=Solea solea TaxID=90069 RepID=UPI00272BB498|nr:homeobox protein Hox-B7a isoform X2 [Solea solea]